MTTSPTKPILPYFFNLLDERNISYAVLRGFESLPETYSNDIDFGLLNSDLDEFISTLVEVGNLFDYSLRVRDIRLDVLKLSLSAHDEIDIDIWTGFNYVGLLYLDHHQMISDYRFYNGIKVLKPENELALSYLKELLHMSRLRRDKVASLKSKLNSPYWLPLENYFSSNLIDEFANSIKEERFILKQLALKTRLHLFYSNIKQRGVRKTFSFIVKFIEVRLRRKELIRQKTKLIKSANSILTR